MFKIIREKWYLLGYIIITCSIGQFAYICFKFAYAILNNKERTVVNSNGIATIGKTHFYYTNIFLLIFVCLIFSSALIWLGVFIIKKGKKNGIRKTM